MIIIFVSLLIVSLFVMVLKPDILMDTSRDRVWPIEENVHNFSRGWLVR